MQRSLHENTKLAFVGDLATKIETFILLVVTARLLSIREFAVFSVAITSVTLLTALFDWGSFTLIIRDGASDSSARGGLLLATVRARLLPCFLIVLAVCVWGFYHGRLIDALLAVSIAVTGALVLSILAVFRAAQNLAREALQKIVLSVLALLASLGAVVFWQRSATAALAGLAIAWIATLPLLIHPPIGYPITKQRARRILVRSAPFALLSLATLIYYRAGTLLLSALGSPRDVGVFTIAAMLAFGFLVFPNAITAGLLPLLSGESEIKPQEKNYALALKWTFRGGLLIALLIAALAPLLLPLVYGQRYKDATAVLLILVVADLLIGLEGLIGTALISSGRSKAVVIQAFVSLAVSLGVSLALIPSLAARGSALGILTAEIVAFSILVIAARRLEFSTTLGPARWTSLITVLVLLSLAAFAHPSSAVYVSLVAAAALVALLGEAKSLAKPKPKDTSP